MGYTSKAVKGISWAWAQSVSTSFISSIRIIILARILSPSQFGIYGIALLVTAFLETLTETGINIFLIQQKENYNKYINSAWIVSILRGVIISTGMLISSGWIASFFRSPDSFYILIIFSIIPLIKGFINPSEIKFQKELNFDIEYWYRLIIYLTEVIVSVVLVYFTKSILGLAVGVISGAVIELLLSFLIVPRPRFIIEKKYIFQIFHQGKWITISGIFNYLYHNIDNIVVGRLLGTSALGLYETAYNISMLPIVKVSDVVSKVTFPVYSLISADRVRLRVAFLKSIIFLSIITIPFGIILFIFPHQIVSLVLGPKWLGMTGVLQILVIFGVIRAISGSSSALLLSVGKQKYVMLVTLVSLAGLAVTIVPLVNKFGIYGAGIAALIGSLVSLPFMFYFSIKVLNKNYYEKS